MAKYTLDENDTIKAGGTTLYRIVAAKNFSDVSKGQTGGYVESEDNLSHDGDCWIYDDSMVYGYAVVENNAVVRRDAMVYEYAKLRDFGSVTGDVKLHGNCEVNDSGAIVGKASIDFSGDIVVCGQAVVEAFDKLKLSGRFAFTDNNTYGTL